MKHRQIKWWIFSSSPFLSSLLLLFLLLCSLCASAILFGVCLAVHPVSGTCFHPVVESAVPHVRPPCRLCPSDALLYLSRKRWRTLTYQALPIWSIRVDCHQVALTEIHCLFVHESVCLSAVVVVGGMLSGGSCDQYVITLGPFIDPSDASQTCAIKAGIRGVCLVFMFFLMIHLNIM